MFSLFGPEIKSCNRPGEDSTKDGSPRGCLVPTMNDYLEHRGSKIQGSKTIASPCEPDFLDLRESKRQGFDFALPSEKRQQYDTLAYQAINAPQPEKPNGQISSEAEKLASSIKQEPSKEDLKQISSIFEKADANSAKKLIDETRQALKGSNYSIAMSAAAEVWLGRKLEDNGHDSIYVLTDKIKDAQCTQK